MKPKAFVSLIYGLIVIAYGIMGYSYENKILTALIQIPCGILILLNIYFFIKDKKISNWILLILSFLLSIFYGYIFSQTTHFFPALLTGISFFIFMYEILRIFRVFTVE